MTKNVYDTVLKTFVSEVFELSDSASSGSGYDAGQRFACYEMLDAVKNTVMTYGFDTADYGLNYDLEALSCGDKIIEEVDASYIEADAEMNKEIFDYVLERCAKYALDVVDERSSDDYYIGRCDGFCKLLNAFKSALKTNGCDFSEYGLDFIVEKILHIERVKENKIS